MNVPWQVDWQAPRVEHRPLPIVHDLSAKADIQRYVEQAAAHGVGGFVTNVIRHPGFTHEWGRLRGVIEAVQAAGLRIWIYDEDGYPSGAAGGRVLKDHPELEAQALVDTGIDRAPADRFQVRPAFEHTPAAQIGHRVLRAINIMDDRAVRRFIELTHETYLRELGETFRHVEAFFTDEPSLVAYYIRSPESCANRAVVDVPDPAVPRLPCVPWVYDLPEQYQKAYDEDLMPLLASLFAGTDPADQLVRRNYWTLVARLVRDRYFGQIAKWCEAHAVALTGHLLCEEHLWVRIVHDGNAIACLGQMQIPGMDLLSSNPAFVRAGHGWLTALQPSSAAVHNGTRKVMTEVSDCEQSAGWVDRPPADLGWMCATAAWQAALGVTEFTLYYSLQNLPAGQGRAYGDFVGRLNAVLRDATPWRNVGLFYCLEDLREELLPTADNFNEVAYPERFTAIDAGFHALGTALVSAQYAFGLFDTAMLASATVEGDQLVVGRQRLDALVVPARATLPEVAAVRHWAAGSGRVVRDVPALDVLGIRSLVLDPPAEAVVMGQFVRDGVLIHVLVNTGAAAYRGGMRLDPRRSWTGWYPETGAIRSWEVGSDGRIALDLAACETVILSGLCAGEEP